MQTSLSFCKERDNRVRLSETLAITLPKNLLLLTSALARFIQSFFKPRHFRFYAADLTLSADADVPLLLQGEGQ
ncbi:MAG: hypothetical protein D0433_12855 [Candidatus Thermochlorobacter aerophilum]|uniref:Uncharacterized protein n=1 Tax=Candidatus Thermochlorobacter aerophilus TaxID=1868324 RepID=A0A395LX20_9BACT|nr:MAG: hypothetical protein D0433_12855 [Candidatus Thermochlorobacter aerophilum]